MINQVPIYSWKLMEHRVESGAMKAFKDWTPFLGGRRNSPIMVRFCPRIAQCSFHLLCICKYSMILYLRRHLYNRTIPLLPHASLFHLILPHLLRPSHMHQVQASYRESFWIFTNNCGVKSKFWINIWILYIYPNFIYRKTHIAIHRLYC